MEEFDNDLSPIKFDSLKILLTNASSSLLNFLSFLFFLEFFFFLTEDFFFALFFSIILDSFSVKSIIVEEEIDFLFFEEFFVFGLVFLELFDSLIIITGEVLYSLTGDKSLSIILDELEVVVSSLSISKTVSTWRFFSFDLDALIFLSLVLIFFAPFLHRIH